MGEGVKAQTQVGFLMQKISEMNREELRDYMIASGEIDVYDDDSKAWKRAFQLGRLAGNEHWVEDCNKCLKALQEWLLA